MEIWVQVRGKVRGLSKQRAARDARRVLSVLGLSDAQLSLVLADDEEMAKINELFLGRKGPTNVIAFSQLEGEGSPVNPNLLGDIVISVDTCRRESTEAAVSFHGRFLQLLVHGVLHLLGYEHEAGGELARAMEAEERRILSCLGPTSIHMHGTRGVGGGR